MTLSGSISAAGSSAVIMLRPNESMTVVLSVSATQFEGTVSVQESTSQQAWKTTRDLAGVELTYTYANGSEFTTGTIVSTTVRNTSKSKRYYRVNAPVVAEDPVVYLLTEVDGDIAQVLVSDLEGNPLIVLLDNGQIKTLRNLTAPGVSSGDSTIVEADVTISAADIVSTSAGKLGHANGYPLVAGLGADIALEFISALLIYDRATATYGAGGNLTINLEAGGAALTGLVSAANSIGAGTDKIALFRPLATAAELITANKGINLVSSAAFTNPGTAAGVVRMQAFYRAHTLGLA